MASASSLPGGRLKYLTNPEIREEIAEVIGTNPDRFRDAKSVEMRRRELLPLADALLDLPLEEIEEYENVPIRRLIAKRLGMGSVSFDRRDGFDRQQLKAIHRALDAGPEGSR